MKNELRHSTTHLLFLSIVLF